MILLKSPDIGRAQMRRVSLKEFIMKLKHFVCVLLVSLMMFTSCGEVSVAGKHFENEYYPLSVDFAPKGDKVFYMAAVGTYKVKGADIEIVINGKTNRLVLKENTLYEYEKDEAGNPTKNISTDGFTFVEKGMTDFFTNVLSGTEQTVNGVNISFSDTEAAVGNYSVGYSFDEETGKYTIDGCEPTFYKNTVYNNAYNRLIESAFPDDGSKVDYEKAFWARQAIKTSIDDELVSIFLGTYYPEEYEKALYDEFAMHSLTEKVLPEIQEKLDSFDPEEPVTLITSATLGKYDFNKGVYAIKTSFDFGTMSPTLSGCKYPMEIRLGKLKKGYLFDSIFWYSGIGTDVTMAMTEDKASALNSSGVSDFLLVYNLVPIMTIDSDQASSEMSFSLWGNAVREKYILYYEIQSAELYSKKDLTKIGDMTVTSRY